MALFIVLATLVSWVGVNSLEGGFWDEFSRPADWIPPSAGMIASLAVYFLARSSRLSVTTIIGVGLGYEVFVSYMLAVGQYWNTFLGIEGARLTPDLVGVSAVALWMAFFTVIVPARPRHALIALTLSGAAVPITILVLVRMGNMDAPAPMDFVFIFVLPYLMTVTMCMIAANVIYGLGRDVRAAQQIGSYHLLGRIGTGGMGEVWRARHALLARPAAIKLIRPDALSTDPVSQQEMLSRFEREAQVTASLQSPHTVRLYDYGISDDGSLFYVMELLDGVDLDRLVKTFGPLPPERVVHVLRQICASLAEAHGRGLVHRDIKPANVMVCENALTPDFVKVLDFGLVKRFGIGDPSDTSDVRLTKMEMMVGTPAFAAPELVQGESGPDGRADIYSLGCVAFWLLTGRLVFEARTPLAVLMAHAREQPPLPSMRAPEAVPPELDDLVVGCLSKQPRARPPTAEAVADRLDAIRLERPWTTGRARSWWSVKVRRGSLHANESGSSAS